MRVGIDLDGVVFNSEMYFMACAEIYDVQTLHRNSLVLPGEPRVQRKYAWSEAETEGFIRRFATSADFDVMPCAKFVIGELAKENELIVISARGQFDPAEIEVARKKLKEADISFDRYLFGHLDKTQTVLENKIDVMIDDRYDVCETLSRLGVFCLYFRMAGRKKLPESDLLKEVNHWGEVYRICTERKIIGVH